MRTNYFEPWLVLMVLFGLITWYSAFVVVRNSQKLIGKCDRLVDKTEMPEYTILVGHHLGSVGELVNIVVAFCFGLAVNILNFILLAQEKLSNYICIKKTCLIKNDQVWNLLKVFIWQWNFDLQIGAKQFFNRNNDKC